MTLVSVIIPVYNHEDFVEDAVQSVIDQDHSPLEIVCVDDGSADSSLRRIIEVARRTERTLQVVPQQNLGAHAALNRGAELARGDVLMFLNSDDRYGPHRVHAFASAWERIGKPELFWGFSGVSFIDESGGITDPVASGVGHLSDYNDHLMRGVWAADMFAFRNVMLTSGNLVLTRALFDRTGGFQPYRMVHDWQMALSCLLYSSPLVIQESHYCYRIHGRNTFRSIDESEGWRESRLARDAYLQRHAEMACEQSVLHTMLPGVDYLQFAYDLRAPLTH